MNLKSIRLVVGANLLAATCLLMQGCSSSSDKKAEEDVAVVPSQEETKTAEPVVAPEEEIKPVAMTTAYTVKKGDTISGIASKYNLRWQDVVAVNAGLTPNKIRVGQVIQLPGQVDLSKEHRVAPAVKAPKTSAPKGVKASATPVSGANYVVKNGDTLGGIAHHFGVKVAALREVNNLKNDKIVVGQKLKVPGAKAAAETKKSVEKTTAPKVAAPKAAVKTEEKVAADAAPAVTPAPAATETAPLPPPPVATPAATPAPADAAAPAAATPAQNYQTHQVKEGEDLYGIAIRWGCSPADLKALNNLTGSDLKPGTVLKIPN